MDGHVERFGIAGPTVSEKTTRPGDNARPRCFRPLHASCNRCSPLVTRCLAYWRRSNAMATGAEHSHERHGMSTMRLVVSGVLVLCLVIFIAQNLEKVTIDFLFFSIETSM